MNTTRVCFCLIALLSTILALGQEAVLSDPGAPPNLRALQLNGVKVGDDWKPSFFESEFAELDAKSVPRLQRVSCVSGKATACVGPWHYLGIPVSIRLEEQTGHVLRMVLSPKEPNQFDIIVRELESEFGEPTKDDSVPASPGIKSIHVVKWRRGGTVLMSSNAGGIPIVTFEVDPTYPTPSSSRLP
jgi:hypothetical protein